MIPTLPPLLLELVRLCVWLLILSILFIPLERLFALHPQRVFRKGMGADLGYYFINSLLPAAALSMPLRFVDVWAHRLFPSGWFETMASLPVAAHLGLGLLASELGYYWGHRLSHEIPLLWRFHAIHHSAEEMDFLVNTRAHPVDMVFGRFCALVPLYALGLATSLTPEGNLTLLLIVVGGRVWSFFIHSNVRWRFGLLEWLVSSPHFHHWHHTRTGQINHNYSSMLPFLDWLFGSFHLPKTWPADYGIQGTMPSALLDQLIHPVFPLPDVPQGSPEARDDPPSDSV